jgi:hypothetical protein
VGKISRLEDQTPEYGLEALVSTIDDRDKLIKALKAASERCSMLKRQT